MKERSLEYLDRRFQQFMRDRNAWEGLYAALNNYFLPHRGRFFPSQANKGDRKTHHILDPAPVRQVKRCGAGLLTGLTSPARPWTTDQVQGRDMDELDQQSVEWLQKLTKVKFQIWRAARLYDELVTHYEEAAVFGTAVMIAYPDFENVVHFQSYTCGEYWIGVDARNRVKEFATQISLTAGQIADEFGEEDDYSDLPLGVRTALNAGQVDDRFIVRHYIGPNKKGSGPQDPELQPFVSDYWITSGSSQGRAQGPRDFLARRGFAYNPIICTRWDRVGRDAYGRGPGELALGEAMQLQAMASDRLRAIEILVSPPLQAPGMPGDRQLDYRPGAMNVTPRDTKIESLWGHTPDLNALMAVMQEVRNSIAETFFNDILATFIHRSELQKTATEVQEMSQEKLALFAPVATRFVADLLIPINEATHELMIDADLMAERQMPDGSRMSGAVGPPPQQIAGSEVSYEFNGELAQAANLPNASRIERMVAFAGQVANLKPEALDKLSGEELISEYAGRINVPAGVLVPDADMIETRRKRAAQAENDQGMAMLREGASVARDLGQAQLSDQPGDTALAALAGAVPMGGAQ